MQPSHKIQQYQGKLALIDAHNIVLAERGDVNLVKPGHGRCIHHSLVVRAQLLHAVPRISSILDQKHAATAVRVPPRNAQKLCTLSAKHGSYDKGDISASRLPGAKICFSDRAASVSDRTATLRIGHALLRHRSFYNQVVRLLMMYMYINILQCTDICRKCPQNKIVMRKNNSRGAFDPPHGSLFFQLRFPHLFQLRNAPHHDQQWSMRNLHITTALGSAHLLTGRSPPPPHRSQSVDRPLPARRPTSTPQHTIRFNVDNTSVAGGGKARQGRHFDMFVEKKNYKTMQKNCNALTI